ncbi:MAG TPA: N-acetylmuramoyl-L-alanine amidase, partial [Candidatus Saccharimonadales bacterium]|nr:N-acetylmuramoyl-L-alanine amidase [Candidatus Saccharimonadales bacterium]
MSVGRDAARDLRAQKRRAARTARDVRLLRALLLSGLLLIAVLAASGLWTQGGGSRLSALTASLELAAGVAAPTVDAQGAAVPGDTAAALAAAGAKVVPGDPPGWVRVPRPSLTGPRKVGIQAGHWKTSEAPPELSRLIAQTGTSWNGYNEVDSNLAIAERVVTLLRSGGIDAEVLPTTVPTGYLADAVVALHADGDETEEKSGFKLAHSTRRTPYEDALQRVLTDAYAAATGLEYDAAGISNNMRNYYLFSWSRVRSATSPFTPSVILELGFLSNDHDRDLILNRQDVLAGAIAAGIRTFLEA